MSGIPRKICAVDGCPNPLRNRRKFCSDKCLQRNKYLKNKSKCNESSYRAQRERGIQRKLWAVNKLGGECKNCGYKANLGALSFHHVNSNDKLFGLDMRRFSNNSMTVLEEELKKVELLCVRCHIELENPHLNLPL